VLPALYCSLLLLSSASWQLALWRCACALKQAASVSESRWLLKIVMPILARLKRREARRSNNAALAADAVQSAACAYLAVIALAGLAINAAFHIAWFDSLAALAAIPLLLKEGRASWNGKACGCC
jgi:hypothetical protein